MKRFQKKLQFMYIGILISFFATYGGYSFTSSFLYAAFHVHIRQTMTSSLYTSNLRSLVSLAAIAAIVGAVWCCQKALNPYYARAFAKKENRIIICITVVFVIISIVFEKILKGQIVL